ncbi:MAG: hypothetical protein ACE5OQ_11070 [Woeseia sp.]
MNHQESPQAAIGLLLIIAATLTLASPSYSDEFPFRVAFERVPGAEDIDAGNIQAGIKVLVNQLNQIERWNRGDVLATLCAAYIVELSLDKAERACNEAVEIDPTETAYNNRGVLRAFTGNLSGAREDFDRVRPRQLDVYLSELKTKDVGVDLHRKVTRDLH